ncbi:hypothetical protein COCON_G00222490 [Conger conger]|uniref:Uncharacterized protein n=1 Tax=Conger conger TaxID=82655 RepID=A0A9Q1CWT0_CONCO|nr:hypothetical protein COCON_G00222490 [Conger conger]
MLPVIGKEDQAQSLRRLPAGAELGDAQPFRHTRANHELASGQLQSRYIHSVNGCKTETLFPWQRAPLPPTKECPRAVGTE